MAGDRMRKTTLIFLAILILAAAIRLVNVDRSFLSDEFKTIMFSKLPVGEMSRVIMKTESYPPLPYLMLSAWLRIFDNDAWVRLLFVILGVFSVIIVYAIGRELRDPRYALTAMFLAAIMPMQVWISQYIRGMSTAVPFLLLSTLFFLKLVKEEDAKRYKRAALGYLASSIMAVYSYYMAFFILFAQSLIYLFFKRNKAGAVFKWSLLQIAVAASFIPWARGFFGQMKDANVILNRLTVNHPGLNIGEIPVGSYIRGLTCFLGMDHTFFMTTKFAEGMPKGMMIAVAVLSMAVIIYISYLFIMLSRRQTREDTLKDARFSAREVLGIFSALAIIPLTLAIASNLILKTAFLGKYFAILSAFMIFIYALILASIRNKRYFRSILAVFSIICLLRAPDYTQTVIDYKGSTNFVKNNIKDDECLLFVGGDEAYMRYSAFPKNCVNSADYTGRYRKGSVYSPRDTIDEKKIYACLDPFNSVWIYNGGWAMANEVQYVLALLEARGYGKSAEFKFKNIKVYKYARR